MKFSYLLNDLRNFNEIFRKDVTYDNIKSHKKPGGFTLSLEDTYFEKPQGEGGSNWLHPAFEKEWTYFCLLQNELTAFGLWTTSIAWRKRLTISIILVENTSVYKLERASAMYKTRHTGTGNGMRGKGRILHSGECRQTFREMSPKIPGGVAKYSGEYP